MRMIIIWQSYSEVSSNATGTKKRDLRSLQEVMTWYMMLDQSSKEYSGREIGAYLLLVTQDSRDVNVSGLLSHLCHNSVVLCLSTIMKMIILPKKPELQLK